MGKFAFFVNKNKFEREWKLGNMDIIAEFLIKLKYVFTPNQIFLLFFLSNNLWASVNCGFWFNIVDFSKEICEIFFKLEGAWNYTFLQFFLNLWNMFLKNAIIDRLVWNIARRIGPFLVGFYWVLFENGVRETLWHMVLWFACNNVKNLRS